MIIKRTLIYGLMGFLLSLSAQAQNGADPAVIGRSLLPAPLSGVGSTFTLSFRIGNNGSVPISGTGTGNANRMQFGICLGKCLPNPASTAALSGPLLAYFDVTYNADNNCFEGRQKQDMAINATTVFSLSIAAIVTSASSSTTTNDIGGSCNIAPNGSANPQPTDNDFSSIYTHTVGTAMPVSLVAFTAQPEADRTVLVSWQTSWERTNQRYVIERSQDLKYFEEVGRVDDVAGNRTSLSSYRYIDQSPYRGRSYHRLRQVDLDGSSTVYPAQWVEIAGRYGVYPNPVVGSSFTLELDEPTTAQLHLYTVSGREVGISITDQNEVSMRVTPSAKLTSGVYILTVDERGNTRKHRLVVP